MMSQKIKLSLIMYSVIGSVIFLNSGLFQQGLAQNLIDSSPSTANDTESQDVNNQTTDKDNGLA